jgi:hypothetical protein
MSIPDNFFPANEGYRTTAATSPATGVEMNAVQIDIGCDSH